MQLAVYPSVHSQSAKMRDLINSYPSAFKAMFGMEGADFTSGPGYLSTETFSLLAPLMLIGPGIALGTGAIATEEERGTLDLLMASPVSRGRVLAAKALGSIAALIATATVLYLTVLITANALDMRISAGMLAQAVSAVQVLACACGGVTFLAHEQDRMPPGSPEPDGKRQDAGLESGWSWTLATGGPESPAVR